MYVHCSVNMWMEAERVVGRTYGPRAKFDAEPTWVAFGLGPPAKA